MPQQLNEFEQALAGVRAEYREQLRRRKKMPKRQASVIPARLSETRRWMKEHDIRVEDLRE